MKTNKWIAYVRDYSGFDNTQVEVFTAVAWKQTGSRERDTTYIEMYSCDSISKAVRGLNELAKELGIELKWTRSGMPDEPELDEE